MNDYKIVGTSKPNKVKLKSLHHRKVVEFPVNTARKYVEHGIINIQNPDILYCRI